MPRMVRRRVFRRVGLVVIALSFASAALIVGTGGQARSDVTSATLVPVADAYVESSTPAVNYGTSVQLVADASPTRQSFLRFDLSALVGPVQSARLRLHVRCTLG